MSNSSLSTVVSDLVRASVGSSVPNSVTDEELDRAVAELILKEAKQKAERYLQDGVRAYLPEPDLDENLPRANKRFLNAIIRSTDDHNKAVLRAQAEAAQDAREERQAQERRERRARASEADAERFRRLLGGAARRRDDHNDWDKSKRRGRHDSRELDRNEHAHKSKRHHSRSRSPRKSDNEESSTRSRHKHRADDDRKSERRHRKRPLSPSPHTRPSEKTQSLETSNKRAKRHEEDASPFRPGERNSSAINQPALDATPMDDSTSVSTKPVDSENSISRMEKTISTAGSSQPRSPRTKRDASPTLSEEEDIERLRPRRRPPLGKQHRESSPGAPPSKMDKYFEASYDPRLDIEPMTIPTVPSTGLIDGTEFERWEAMLDIIRQRREDKLERKRLERQGLLVDKGSGKKAIKGEMASSAAWKGEGASMMDIQYNKRGSVREWDMGKEGF